MYEVNLKVSKFVRSSLILLYRNYYSQNVFGDRDTLLPHKGEVIAAFYAPEESWYRGLVLDTAESKVKVCGISLLYCFIRCF